MTSEDLTRLEQAIGRPLSPAVRHFFLHYPPELRSVTRTILAEYGEDIAMTECAADNELCDDADALIEMNRDVVPLEKTANVLVIGGGDCGELFWVDLDDARGAVYRCEAGQEAEYSDHLADSLEDFA